MPHLWGMVALTYIHTHTDATEHISSSAKAGGHGVYTITWHATIVIRMEQSRKVRCHMLWTDDTYIKNFDLINVMKRAKCDRKSHSITSSYTLP